MRTAPIWVEPVSTALTTMISVPGVPETGSSGVPPHRCVN